MIFAVGMSGMSSEGPCCMNDYTTTEANCTPCSTLQASMSTHNIEVHCRTRMSTTWVSNPVENGKFADDYSSLRKMLLGWKLQLEEGLCPML
jgi:hypothetical protein